MFLYFDIVRLIFLLYAYRITVVTNKSGIGVDGLDVLPIPQSQNALPRPTNSTWEGRVGHVGFRGWGGALGGWGIKTISCIH